MPWFEYEGQCPNGTAIAGRLEAVDHDAARDMLGETMRIALRDVRQAEAPPIRRPISEEEFLFFNEQLASLASIGVALDQGLTQLARDVRSPRLRKFIQDIAADLHKGESLENAVAARESQLPALYSRVVRAGIQTGNLPAALLGLNQHMRLMGETRRILWETLSYPVFVLIVGLAIISFFLLTIVPQFKVMFADFGTSLPGPTLLLLNLAEAYPTILVSAAAFVVAAVLGWRALRLWPGGQVVREDVVGHLPIVGRVYRASLVARFVRSVEVGVQAGLPLPEALRLAGGVTGSRRVDRDADRIAAAVEQGKSVFEAVQLCSLIPGIFGYTLQVALGRDVLPQALAGLSESYENRAIHYQGLLRVLMFPVVVAMVGLILLFGVFALFLPLITLINSVSG
ncbi:MAG: type II secretion system F family protein [Phycisphaerae bacterium]|nr:type II secretion system F family protein [Phycisphaerae bacterium]